MIEKTLGARGRTALLALFALLTCLIAAGSALAADAKPSLSGVVNVNTASSEELQLLPGVGESRAGAIISLRKERGGFKAIDELGDVRGIGDSMLDKLRPFVRLSGKTTLRRL